jgi:Tfp pilus assembly ATPase PilU
LTGIAGISRVEKISGRNGKYIDRGEFMAIEAILTAMVEQKASDLHLFQGNPAAFIVNGKLVRHGSEPLAEVTRIVFLMKPLKTSIGRRNSTRERNSISLTSLR